MRLIISDVAAKALNAMPKQDARLLRTKLEAFAADPYGRHGWAKPLVGTSGTRIRQGDWRAVCRVDGKAMTVDVLEIGNRKDIYQ